MTGFATNAAAHHAPNHNGGNGGGGGGGSGGDSGANQFRFAGQTWDHLYAAADDPADNTSEIVTLLEVSEIKKSNSWQDSLVLQPSIESSLITDVGLSGDADRSEAAAGLLSWLEIRETGTNDWQMITVDDDLVAPPGASEIDEDGAFDGTADRALELARGVVGFNTRDVRAAWDLREITESIEDLQAALEELDEDDDLELEETDWDELFLDVYLRTRSANAFHYTKTRLPGTHDVRLRGALHVAVDDDTDSTVQAQAIVGNRSLLVEPRKIRAAID